MRRSAAIAGGVLFGAAYGWGGAMVVTRVQGTALGTYSFLAGLPLVLAILPYLSARRPTGYGAFFKPMASIVAFTFLSWVTGFESGLCLALIALPMVALTALFALGLALFRNVRIGREIRQHRPGLLLLLLAPFGLALIEARWLGYDSVGNVSAEVEVRAALPRIWSGIVEVSRFTEGELPRNWLHALGVPRPVYATVDAQREGGVRIGHFEGGLRLVERIVTYDRNKELGLAVIVDPNSLRGDDIAGHALGAGFLRVDDVRYRLIPSNGGVRLVLGCRYTVHTTVTPYAHAAARVVFAAFEHSLLDALSHRFEDQPAPPGHPLVADMR